jgi:hypothetical protein
LVECGGRLARLALYPFVELLAAAGAGTFVVVLAVHAAHDVLGIVNSTSTPAGMPPQHLTGLYATAFEFSLIAIGGGVVLMCSAGPHTRLQLCG